MKEGGLDNSRENVNFHKNLFFGLCYLHSVLDGRKQFGALGWNVYCGFDSSDFEISDRQIKRFMQNDIKDKPAVLQMIKHLIANINFASKISRNEDLRKLMAHINDLFSEKLAFCTQARPDHDSSHYGFPAEGAKEGNFENFISRMPETDYAQVFGFNRTNERMKITKTCLQQLENI